MRRDARWERKVLAYDPAASDKDDGGVKILNDRIATARKATTCWLCGGAIVPGTLIRLETAVLDGSIKTSRTCQDCCDAMARSWTDHGRALDARLALR